MGQGRLVSEVEREIAAPVGIVFAMVADSHRRNRMVGGRPASYRYELSVAADPASRRRLGRARMFGLELDWVEVGEQVEGSFLWQERSFVSGPLGRVGFTYALAPRPHGTLLRGSVYVEANPGAPEGFAQLVHGHLAESARKYLDVIVPLIEGIGARAGAPDPSEPPASTARRLLYAMPLDPATAGKRGAVNEDDFQFRWKAFAETPADPALKTRLHAHLRERPDEDLRQMRPFELARAWGLDRRAVLRGFLHAARAGLVDLEWQLNCPTCRVGAGQAQGLEHVRREAHCDECNIDFHLDFAENIEAVFTVNAAIRKVEPQLYCASSPWFRPHVFAGLRPLPRATREAHAHLPPGLLLLHAQRGARRGAIAVGDPPPRLIEARLGPTEVAIRSEPGPPGPDGTLLRIINDTDETVLTTFERAGWNADIVLGSMIVTLPEFLDLFGTEAPAAGVELSVGALTILFSDLTGTTSLCERIGDARVFALVQEHFVDFAEVAAAHAGAMVKTMGDGVMATFESPARALAAALEMVARVERAAVRHGLAELTTRIGLHEGPCLAVRANERLDFFGTTVNVAARLQGQAGRNHVVLSAELAGHAEVARILAGRSVEPFSAELKGLSGKRSLLRVR